MSESSQGISELTGGRQHDRILRLSFPHGDGPASPLLVNRLDAVESLSRPFAYTVELLSDDALLALKDLQGKMMCVQLVRKDGTMRYFTGRVFSFGLKTVDGGVAYYEAQLGPWCKYLSLRKDNYLFHYSTLYQQTQSIFSDYGDLPDWDWRVQGDNPEMTDACQFDETDSNYLERRWAAAGIFYWFEHDAKGHKLILSNDSVGAAPIDGEPEMPFQRHGGAVEEDGITQWSPQRHITQGTLTLASFDFKSPRPELTSLPTLQQQGRVRNIETYDYAGAYGFKNSADARAISQLRMEALEACAKQFEGRGNNRYAMPGRWFRLTGHFDRDAGGNNAQATTFLILEVRHSATNNYQVRQSGPAVYENRLTCIRKIIPWRTPAGHNSTETKVFGIQTATVVGPAGEEIHTDEYGRVRVQFHWDRVGTNDEKSSAWLRVATPWAGENFGMTSIPRVGTEVMVQFLNGNPDRPVITGMVPNANTMPPWPLPANKTQSGILSRSTPGGTYANANALRFEDKKGAEQVWIQAERNLDTEVENDETLTVLNNRTKLVGNNEIKRIKNMLMETVQGNAIQQIGGHKNSLVGKHYKIESGDTFEVTCGQAKFYMDKAGNVAITGKSINISSDGPVQMNGKRIDLNPAGGAAAVTASPKGGGAIQGDIDAEFDVDD